MFAILLSDKMDPFYQNIASFPTVFFTFFFVLSLCYWLIAILGVVDLEFLDLPDVEGDVPSATTLGGVLFKFGLNGVPLTIIISIMSLIGWFLCYFIVHFFFGYVPDGLLRYLAGLPVLIGCLYVSALITGQLIKPLRPIFKKANADSVKDILGQTAVVRSLRVDNSFGEVFLSDGGAGLIFKARSTGDQTFKKGDRVVLFEYLENEHAYRVISEEEFLN
ncbi:DUF1449 domain-containing protein [Litoribrevibacter euphylliae]|uniref:DUF1449 domain-containing protein n=1 Tax=Litoribrevibacter euphylliae TaxID=1834034 RepID=A0ABV7HAL3_9GAMM